MSYIKINTGTPKELLLTYLVAPIAYCHVSKVTTRLEKGRCKGWELSAFNNRGEGMAGMMTVLERNMAWNAQIVILAYSASDEV